MSENRKSLFYPGLVRPPEPPPCLPCTCTPKCLRPCKGYDCGCEKCYEAYQDFLSMPET